MGRSAANEDGTPPPSGARDCTAGSRLAAELRVLRERTGKSLKELEDLVHASDSSISRYLSGRIVPPWSVVERLAHVAREDPRRLRPLWAHVSGDRHRQGGPCEPVAVPEPPAGTATASAGIGSAPASGTPAPGGTSRTTGAAVPRPRAEPGSHEPSGPSGRPEPPGPAEPPDRTAPEAGPAGDGAAPAWPSRPWHRRHPRVAIGAAIAATALLSGTLGLVAGMRLAPRPRPPAVARQDDVCRDWPWPSASAGRVAIAPARVYGHDHTPTVQLMTGTIGGRQMAWARLVGARYGDRVWMDWSQNAGKTWTQCGPFFITGRAFASRAHPLGPHWMFRACGDTPRAAVSRPRDGCTAYW